MRLQRMRLQRSFWIACCLVSGSACSIVVGTGDLREFDGAVQRDASSDASPDASPDADSEPSDAEVDALDADAGCVPNTLVGAALTLSEAGFPTTLMVSFNAPSMCGESVRITGIDDFVADVMIEVGTQTAEFEFTGRVPLFHDAMTSFMVNDERVMAALPTTIEILEDGGVAYEYTFSPMLDIAREGTVVFHAGGTAHDVDGGGDLFIWRMDSVETLVTSASELFAPRISGDGELIVFADRTDNRVEYIYGEVEGLFDIDSHGLTGQYDIDLQSNSDHFFISIHASNGGNNVFHAGGVPKVQFDGVDDITLPLRASGNSVAPARIRPNSDAGADFELGHVEMGIPYITTILGTEPGISRRVGCSVDRNLSRVDVGRPGAALFSTFVGSCGGGLTFYVGPMDLELPEPPLRVNGLVDAERGLRTFLMRDNAASPTETAYTVGRLEMGAGSVEYRALMLQADGVTRGNGLSGLHTNAAAISADGLWAAYALVGETTDGASSMRIVRLKVR